MKQWKKYLFIFICLAGITNIELSGNKSSRMISLILPFIACAQAAEPAIYVERRNQMVENQIISRGIKNPKVLHALRTVKRHLFIPDTHKDRAYEDYPLPIGFDQTISQPYVVALMTEILDIKKNEKVLEIGTGSGYQAAILAEICNNVYTVEIMEPLARRARETLNTLNYKNIKLKIGDGYEGWEDYAPYDAIIVTCAPSHIPQKLKDQLAEGGKMVIPVGEHVVQDLVLLTKENGKLIKKGILDVRFVPMIDKAGNPY